MEIIVIVIFILLVIYILNKNGKNKWKKLIAEFLLHFPIIEMNYLIGETIKVTPHIQDTQFAVATLYIHLTSSVIAGSKQTRINHKHNILTIIQNDLSLCQLFYANYQTVVTSMGIKGIGLVPLEYFDFMEQVSNALVALRK